MPEDGRTTRSQPPASAHVAVVVPAADEAASIADCLAALNRAQDHLREVFGGRVTSSVTVVLDSCTDATGQLAACFPVDLVSVQDRCVGAARAAGCAQALTRHEPWILANTDADSCVPVQWLSALVRHVLDGADVVLGTVRPGPGLPSDDADAWYAAHDLGAEHLHIHGANIALTAEAYRQLGGWRPMSTHEDVALAVAARRSGLRVIAVDDAPVQTSSRLEARAPGGFSSYLRGLGSPQAAVSR